MKIDPNHFEVPTKAEKMAISRQLVNEVPPKHSLAPFLNDLKVVARAKASDDILVQTGRDEMPFAIVHLTWNTPEEPPYPWTTYYKDIAAANAAFRDSSK